MRILESRRPSISLICVGSELLRGKVNTHTSTLARRLAGIGLTLADDHTVGDDQGALQRLIQKGLQDHQVVIVTGGLGPTFDDVTREAASSATGCRLISNPALLRGIQQKFKKARYRRMPPENQRQADLLEGAQAISNPVGTAPGQWLVSSSRILILLPGPPSELIPMLDQTVLPRLKKAFPPLPQAEAHLHFVGVPESVVDHRLRPIMAGEKNADFTILAHLGLVDFDMFVTGRTVAEARRRVHRLTRRIVQVMGQAFYGQDADYPLEKVVAQAFQKHHATLALAESCTGGMLAHRLTDIPGSSSYFSGSVVSYSNDVKRHTLGVDSSLLNKHGAVSREVARAMAVGARERMGSTWGLSITGIAGPDGGSTTKPVGLVYIALSGPKSTRVWDYQFRGSRDAIRQRTVTAALDLLRLIYL